MSYPKHQILADALELLIKRKGASTELDSLKAQVAPHMSEALKLVVLDAICAGLDDTYVSLEKIEGSEQEILNKITGENFDLFDYIVKEEGKSEGQNGSLIFTRADKSKEAVLDCIQEHMSLLYIVESFKDEIVKCIVSRVFGAEKADDMRQESLMQISLKLDVEQAKLRRDLIIEKIYQLSPEELKTCISAESYPEAVEKCMILGDSDIENIQRLLASIMQSSSKTKVLITEPLDVDLKVEAEVQADVNADVKPDINPNLASHGKSLTLVAVGPKWEKIADDDLLTKNLVIAYTGLVNSLIDAGMKFDVGETYTNEVIDQSVTFLINKFSIIQSVSGNLLKESQRVKMAQTVLNQKYNIVV